MDILYTLAAGTDKLREEYGLPDLNLDLSPKLLKAGSLAPAVAEGGLRPMKWGFPAGGGFNSVIRAEGITSRPIFRSAFYRRRCLLPADSLIFIIRASEEISAYRAVPLKSSLFSIGGIYEKTSGSFAVITCASSLALRSFTLRMPVLITKDYYKLWTDQGNGNSEELMPLLRAYNSSDMRVAKLSADECDKYLI